MHSIAPKRRAHFFNFEQSDSSQPHLIDIQFHKKMTLKKVAL